MTRKDITNTISLDFHLYLVSNKGIIFSLKRYSLLRPFSQLLCLFIGDCLITSAYGGM